MEDLRTIVESDFQALLTLNDAVVQQTSPMDFDWLQSLVRMSAYHNVITVNGQVVAFLIALKDGAPYENVNYMWFATRIPHFL